MKTNCLGNYNRQTYHSFSIFPTKLPPHENRWQINASVLLLRVFHPTMCCFYKLHRLFPPPGPSEVFGIKVITWLHNHAKSRSPSFSSPVTLWACWGCFGWFLCQSNLQAIKDCCLITEYWIICPLEGSMEAHTQNCMFLCLYLLTNQYIKLICF